MRELLAAYLSETEDAAAELRALGPATAIYFLKYMRHAAARPGNLALFGSYRTRSLRIPIFKEEHDDCFIVFVMEHEADGDLPVTLVYAGRIVDHRPPPGAGPGWEAAAVAIVSPRLKDFYHVR